MKRFLTVLLVLVMVFSCTSAFAVCKPGRSVTCSCETGGVNQQYAVGGVNLGGTVEGNHTLTPHLKVTITYQEKSSGKTKTKTTGWVSKKTTSLDVPWGSGEGESAKAEGYYKCVECDVKSKTGTARDTW